MSKCLAHSNFVSCIAQLVAALLEAVHHLVFGNKGFDDAQSAERFFQLRHGVAPFTLCFQRLAFQLLTDFPHQPTHARQYQDGEQCQLPAGDNQGREIKKYQNRIL